MVSALAVSEIGEDSFEVLLELKGRIELRMLALDFEHMHSLTWLNGTKGGPFAMSIAFVPGLIRRRADSSGLLGVSACNSCGLEPVDGLGGPNCSSGMGGGEGSRGELEGETPVREGEIAVMLSYCQSNVNFRAQHVLQLARKAQIDKVVA